MEMIKSVKRFHQFYCNLYGLSQGEREIFIEVPIISKTLIAKCLGDLLVALSHLDQNYTV